MHGEFDMDFDGTVNDYGDYELVEMLYPKSIIPAIPIIDLPNEIPVKTKRQFERSFSLFWMDRAACASVLRTAIESIADDLRIPREWSRGHWMTLSHRIGILNQTHPPLADAFHVIKDLGNQGAHTDEVDTERLLKAFELMEIDLDEIYSSKKAARTRLIEELRKK
ncbi:MULTISPECIES: DUF4145 domain-containing protein [Azospirillum]|uniref:DUF4145 domain-containing protein n=1 Tax=Azospirillum TaxID=191 RepID=UPI0013960340|nr:DUF4145 domain-containing protein [Azospirillum lipoferum]